MVAVKSCHCAQPRPRLNDESTCVVCAFKIPREWGSHNIAKTFDRLALGFPASPPASFETLRSLCLAREKAGREHFGYRFHGRNCIRDGKEEAADWANYDAFEIIKALKAGDEERADRILNAMMALVRAFQEHQELGLE